ncbi:Hypothetical_protein [Hexamita inflata]|uniref:Hypothetical_protein n=1 Tax=Hexamita inflata TaxID=28002 RepID=A0AA86PSN9_9EUKA|nr:Hypothetical protein HINF_LOCUS33245 [Hexamita inflata]
MEQIMLSNISQLEWRIISNITTLQANIQSNMRASENYLLQRTQSDIQSMKSYIQSDINRLDYQIRNINEQFAQFQCTRVAGYVYVFKEGKCEKQLCPVQGQFVINGVCQCVWLNAIVENKTCACPSNARLLNSICVCVIEEQIIQNGVCECINGGVLQGLRCVPKP